VILARYMEESQAIWKQLGLSSLDSLGRHLECDECERSCNARSDLVVMEAFGEGLNSFQTV
jgi:hypothetical protein